MTRLERSRWVENNQEADEQNEWFAEYINENWDVFFEEFKSNFSNLLLGFPESIYDLPSNHYLVFCHWFISDPTRECNWIEWLADKAQGFEENWNED